MIPLLICVVVLYCVLIAGFFVGIYKVPTLVLTTTAPKTKFSIVIAFRNEANNLPHLLNSLTQLNYPPQFFEVILVMSSSYFLSSSSSIK